MAKPSGTLPEWATTPADPGDLVEPATGLIEAGWQPNDRPPAQILNWWQNRVGQWATWLNAITTADGAHTYEAGPQTRTRFFGVGLVAPNVHPTANQPHWAVEENVATSQISPESRLKFEFGHYFQEDATLLTLAILVKPSTAGDPDKIKLIGYRHQLDWDTPSLIGGGGLGTAESDGTTDLQVVTLTFGSPRPADRHLGTIGCEVLSYAVGDLLYGFRVSYTELGARGY